MRLLPLALAIALAASSAAADDTDIYVDPAAGGRGAPMVMFSIDYRANLASTVCASVDHDCHVAQYFRAHGLGPDVDMLGGSLSYLDLLRLSIKLVLNQPEFVGLRVGLMLSHNDENASCAGATPASCSNGGAILMGFRAIEHEDANHTLRDFDAILKRLRTLSLDPSCPEHPYQGAELFFELFRYLTGQPVHSGHSGSIDFEKPSGCRGGQSIDRASNMDRYAPASWDPSIEDAGRYVSPLAGDLPCTKIYTVNFLFGVAQQDGNSGAAMQASRSAGGLGLQLPSSRNDWFESVVRLLHDSDLADGSWGAGNPALDGQQGVTSYFFVRPEHANKLDRHAVAGGSERARALTDDPARIVRDLGDVLREILSVGTTFVAASIPVDAFNRAAVVDSVYLALFQPAADGGPAWAGNVKKLRIGEANGRRTLLDADGRDAIDAATGRISASALTRWTQASALTDGDGVATFPGKDGGAVARGGAGQKLPGFLDGSPGLRNGDPGARQLFFLQGDELAALDATPAVAAELMRALSAASAAEAQTLLRFARGLPLRDADRDGIEDDLSGAPAAPRTRPWLLGDPLHSRPLPVNYGALDGHGAGNPAIYIAAGANDGFLHFVRDTTPAGAEDGAEAWAFMPPEGLAVQKALKDDVARPATPRHPYSVDGAPASLILDRNGDGTIDAAAGDRAYLYFGLRRGGRAYYALDVSIPTRPVFKWRIARGGDFPELGLTFSTPRAGRVRTTAGEVHALFFGGGYDAAKDAPQVGRDDAEGNAIYVVDAETGALIWKATRGATTGSVDATQFHHSGLRDSIPSGLTIADTDGDGFVDRVVFGDTGGTLWRADVGGSDTAGWSLHRLATLGRHAPGATTRATDRRFHHEPDLVQARDGVGPYDAVIVGSGDRENPLDKPDPAGAAGNWLYVVKDRAVAPIVAATTPPDDSPLHHSSPSLADVSDNCLQEGAPAECGLDLSSGWKLRLPRDGEKALAPPLTFRGTVFFTTYVPERTRDAQTCAPSEGSGYLYALRLDDATVAPGDLAAARGAPLASDGIPAQVVYVPGAGDETLLRPDLRFADPGGSGRYRTFWQRVED